MMSKIAKFQFKTLVITYFLFLSSYAHSCGIPPTPTVELLDDYPGVVASKNEIEYVEKNILHKRISLFGNNAKSNVKIITPPTPAPKSRIKFDFNKIHIPKGYVLKQVIAIVEDDLRIHDIKGRHFTTKGHRLISLLNLSKPILEYEVSASLLQEQASIVVFSGYESIKDKSISYILDRKRLPIDRQGSCSFGGFYTFTKEGLEHHRSEIKRIHH